MRLFDFLHNHFGEQPKKKIQFSFGYVLADIDPDGELGPAVLRNYTIIKYRVPELEIYGEVAVADSTQREMPLLWSDAAGRYGAKTIIDTDVNFAEIGYVRVRRKREGFEKLPHIEDIETIRREFVLEEDVSVLPPRRTMSFLIRPQSGEVYHEYYGKKDDEPVENWRMHHRYLEYENSGKECYILSDWIPGYYDVSWEYVLKVYEILSNRP